MIKPPFAEIWLPSALLPLEPEFIELIDKLRSKGINVVIFESGSGSLYDTTLDLLCHNQAL